MGESGRGGGRALGRVDRGRRSKQWRGDGGKRAEGRRLPGESEIGARVQGEFLAGSFPKLEDQIAGMIAGGAYEGPGRSPDRADAMVWAVTELGETKSGLPRVRRL